MIPSPAVQHRVKHFDNLLIREIEYIQRTHEQNLVTHEKLERSIHRDKNRIKTIKKKKISTAPIDESIYEKSGSSIFTDTTVNSETLINEKHSQIIPRYHRHCFKARRLPPIMKSNRQKRITNNNNNKNDLHWTTNFQSTNIENETETLIDEELPKLSLPELTPIQKQIHSFMETLPANKGVHKGFDNFAPSSLYSYRASVVMK